MAYHKWDAAYYEGKYSKCREDYNRLTLKYLDLQLELRRVREKVEFIDEFSRPVLFIEEGSLLNADAQIELLFQFRVVWVKRGFTVPQFYEPKTVTLASQVFAKKA